MTIQNIFNEYASQYYGIRRKLIPCYDNFYQIAIEVIPFDKDKSIAVLDLGTGTGLMSGLVASNYPNAKIHLIDIAENMLSKAKENLKCFNNEFDYIISDYSKMHSLDNNYDVVISALSIHHLEAEKKQELFKHYFGHP